jgi:hypothetical protein
MPAYPCAQCSTPVDVRDLTCRSCGDKQPFTCSKCNKRLGAMQVHNAEQLTFQKPLFCEPCGKEVQPVTCPKCNTDVYRNAGVADEGAFYHPECFKTIALQRKITPILQVVLLLFGGYATYTQVSFYSQSTPIGLVAGLFGACVGFFLGSLMAPRKPTPV